MRECEVCVRERGECEGARALLQELECNYLKKSHCFFSFICRTIFVQEHPKEKSRVFQ